MISARKRIVMIGFVTGLLAGPWGHGLAADRPTPRQTQRPAVTAPKPLPRVPAEPSAAQRARLEAACARYRVVYGMDCPTENGSGVNGVDVLKDVRRLPLKEPARK
jgi:hypothetical protein